LTTMIGFGSLMLYLMRGMASMGLVLFIGVGACFVITITVLPALVSLLEDRFIPKTEEEKP
jgi:predicted RND superfamily exporter protein